MLILTQNEEAFFDTERFLGIIAEKTDDGHGAVFIDGYDGATFCLGEYKDLDRAREIVKEIFSIVDCMSRYSMPII